MRYLKNIVSAKKKKYEKEATKLNIIRINRSKIVSKKKKKKMRERQTELNFQNQQMKMKFYPHNYSRSFRVDGLAIFPQ